MKVEDIRKTLVDLYGMDKEEVDNIKGKTALVDLLKEKLGEPVEIEVHMPNLPNLEDIIEPVVKNTVDSFLENFNPNLEDDNNTTAENTPTFQPNINDPDWTEYVLNQLSDNELSNKAPNVHGLRRVVEKLLNVNIIKSTTKTISVPNEDNQYRAVVEHTIVVLDLNTPYQIEKTYSDVADACKFNCEPPYDRHLLAVAATRAEARVLRKLLRINVISAEETVNIENCTPIVEDISLITESQVRFLDKICARANINVMKYINIGKNNRGEVPYASIYELSKQTAAEAIQYLNQFQGKTDKVPSTIQGYDENWSKK